MGKPVVSIVAALHPQMGIGYRGGLPWNLPQEMKYFRQATSSTFDPSLSNAVIMGRNTWESIPAKFRPLKNRFNVVLSSQFPKFQWQDDKFLANDLTSAIDSLQNLPIERIYIIGGAQLYSKSIDLATHWLITKIHYNPADSSDEGPQVDTFLPDLKHLQETSPEQLENFLPNQVKLPPLQSLHYGNHHYGMENNFIYWYTLYSRCQEPANRT